MYFEDEAGPETTHNQLHLVCVFGIPAVLVYVEPWTGGLISFPTSPDSKITLFSEYSINYHLFLPRGMLYAEVTYPELSFAHKMSLQTLQSICCFPLT